MIIYINTTQFPVGYTLLSFSDAGIYIDVYIAYFSQDGHYVMKPTAVYVGIINRKWRTLGGRMYVQCCCILLVQVYLRQKDCPPQVLPDRGLKPWVLDQYIACPKTLVLTTESLGTFYKIDLEWLSTGSVIDWSTVIDIYSSCLSYTGRLYTLRST